MSKFIIKPSLSRRPQVYNRNYIDTPKVEEQPTKVEEVKLEEVKPTVEEQPKKTTEKPKEENKKVNEKVMTTSEKIAMAQDVLNNVPTKRIKRDKGLIERAESAKTILTEDNKELLND